MSSFLEEIAEQPEALRYTLESLGPGLVALEPLAAKLREGEVNRVVLTGMGSSYYATSPALIYLIERGITALAVDAAELLHYQRRLVDSRTLLVAISQSGRSVEIVRLLDTLDPGVSLVGITNDPQSPLARRSSVPLYLGAGAEGAVSTKTYTCTLAALHLMARALAAEPLEPAVADLRRLAQDIQATYPGWHQQTGALATWLGESRYLVYLGRGPSCASAQTGALITKEAARIPAEGMGGGHFRHGPMELIAPDIALLIFASPGRTRHLNLGLAQDLAGLGGKVLTFGNADQPVPGAQVIDLPASDEWLAPLAEIVPVQLLVAHLAAQRGLSGDRFRYGQKITTRE